MTAPRTLYDKIWDAHLVSGGGDDAILYIDLHLIHEVTTPQAFAGLALAGRGARRPHRTLAIADHDVPTAGQAAGTAGVADAESRLQLETLTACARWLCRVRAAYAPPPSGRALPMSSAPPVRMARARLFDVPRHEPGPARTRPALRLHLELQFRGTSGAGWPDAPDESRHGCCCGDRMHHRCARTPAMTPFTMVRAIAAPLSIANVDTDMILAGRFLKTVARVGLGHRLFAAWREDPDFILNREGYRAARILVAGENFGCGSSREHAPWALLDFDIRCVVTPSFADIFYCNSVNCGPLAAIVDALDGNALLQLAADRPQEAAVDLHARTITMNGQPAVSFAIGDLPRRRLMEGRNAIADTLVQENDIRAFEERHEG